MTEEGYVNEEVLQYTYKTQKDYILQLLNVRKWHILAQGSVSVLLKLRNFCFLRFEGFCNCQDSLIEVSLGRELGSAMLAGEPDAFVLAQLMPVHISPQLLMPFQHFHICLKAHASVAFVCLAFASLHLSLFLSAFYGLNVQLTLSHIPRDHLCCLILISVHNFYAYSTSAYACFNFLSFQN